MMKIATTLFPQLPLPSSFESSEPLRFQHSLILPSDRESPHRRLDHLHPFHHPPLRHPVPLLLRPYLPCLFQIRPLPLCQLPRVGELDLGFELVVAEIERHVFEHVGFVSGFVHERVDQVAQVPFVLRGRLEHLRAHLHDVGFGVVARSDELDQFDALRFRQVGEVPCAEFQDDFLFARVRFAHVGRVAEAEGVVEGWRGERFG